tara:strand:- start:436 stop:1065 length:630 start_codon:yes stop_codon:yes gene_type:complete
MADKSKSKETKEVTEEVQSPWYYFYSVGCGFCKKVDPIIDELIKEGHDILKLDVAQGDNQNLSTELKKEYNAQCGTPWFINAETGKGVCGYREKDILEKWLNGEDIPAPPRPNGPPPPPPSDWEDKKLVSEWEEKYEAWRKDNSHMPNLPDSKTTGDRLRVQQQRQAQMTNQQGGGANNTLVNNRLQVLEGKLGIVENKLDQILQKLQG